MSLVILSSGGGPAIIPDDFPMDQLSSFQIKREVLSDREAVAHILELRSMVEHLQEENRALREQRNWMIAEMSELARRVELPPVSRAAVAIIEKITGKRQIDVEAA